MSLRIQLSLLFLIGGLVLSDAAQASSYFSAGGEWSPSTPLEPSP